MWRRWLIGIAALGGALIVGTGQTMAHDEWDDENVRYESPGELESGLQILEGYGQWVWIPTHGRVWRPRVESDWRPYWRGHWAWQGQWVWVSADPWGDVPFHYGRWRWSSRYGWVWIPGTVWAPAHVHWIVSGPVIAWAPIGIEISFHSDPRFYSYADADTFRNRVVRPHRIPPPSGYLNARYMTRDIGRVIVPAPRTPRREFRSSPPLRESRRDVGDEPRIVRPQPSPGSSGIAAPRSRAQKHEMGRGFERRSR